MLKLKILLTVLSMLLGVRSFTQDQEKVFTSNQFIWCGLDFSETKCVGSEGFNDPKKIVDYYFYEWNQLMLDEAPKYNFAKAYKKELKGVDLSAVHRRNGLVDHGGLVVESTYKFKEGTVERVIKDYTLEKFEEGLGLVYIIESLNKTGHYASVNVVFFDVATREVLWKKRYTTRSQGFGIRNYWARTVYYAIQLSADDYKYDKKDYLKALMKKG